MTESCNMGGLPEEIIINDKELTVDENGNRYLEEVDGIRYGGDYLDKLPAEIVIDEEELPPPPPEVNHVL